MRSHNSKVKAWEGEISIPTYILGPEDKNPPILMGRKNPIHPGSSIIYPYPLQENLTDNKEDRIWKALFLENEYLLLTFLPELGGRLLSVIDKVTGEEALYRNHVLKFARIGIRGAWVSGGIEWNFPNGHTVTTSSPIDYAVREDNGDSATVFLSDIERVSRMKWSVGVTLYREKAFFETHVRLFNRTFLPNRFWFWSNSAAPASPGLEFITTATKVMTLKEVLDFPVHDGSDLRWDKNHKEPQDLFSLNLRDDFVGWYNHDSERGLVHYAYRTEVRGRKFYTWGNSDDGRIWTELLTDNDGPYSEMQSGRLITQKVWEILPPLTVETWKEVWYPIRRIGSPVCANEKAALSFNINREKLNIRIGVHVTSTQSDAHISLNLGKNKIWSEKRDLEPDSPYIIEVPVKVQEYLNDKVTLSLTNERGEVLAQYVKDKERYEVPIKGYYQIEPIPETDQAEELWLCGIDFEKVGDLEKARGLYERALKVDPDFSPAHLWLGIIHLRSGEYREAINEFNFIIDRNSSDEAAVFFLGVSYITTEQFEKAIGEFEILARSQLFGAASSFILGALYLGQGNVDRSIEKLKKSIDLYPENLDGMVFLASAFRKKRMFNEAGALLKSVLKKDPTSFLALAEEYFLAEDKRDKDELIKSKGKLEKIFRDEFQSYLELACDYARFGLYNEGIKVLLLYKDIFNKPEKISPLVYYHLGYYLEKVNELEEAHKYYGLGGERDPSFVFPHRLESEMVLKRVIDLVPQDGKAKYYLGNLLCSRYRVNEALKLWEQAVGALEVFSVVHRNLGLACWRTMDEPDRAIEEYESALKCDPNDYKLYCELDQLYASMGLYERRQDLIKSIPDELLKNDIVTERVAMYYTDVYEFDKALEILRSTKFFPWEAYTEGRRIYEDANIGKGITLMKKGQCREAIASFQEGMKYPRNLGVGEPLRRGHAEILYRMGTCYERLGETETAESLWEKAVKEEHPEGHALRYYEARALQCLGKKEDADLILDGLLNYAQESITEKSGNEADNLYLLGLSYKGKGDKIKALQVFRRAFARDCTHRRLRWEIDGFSVE